MNELDFPVRIYEKAQDDLVLMVAHDDNHHWGNARAEYKERQDKTRDFCNWVRKTFSTKLTEYRFVNQARVRDPRYRGSWYSRNRTKIVNRDKHFVVYGLTRADLMLIKLSWVFKTQPVCLRSEVSLDDKVVRYLVDSLASVEPTSTLMRRVRNAESKKKKKDDERGPLLLD